jgi:murein DD-endopeptidase MepM/ murein hydrolase activator NlpD
MTGPRILALAWSLALFGSAAASAQIVSRTVGQITVSADVAQAFPGGLIIARLVSRRGAGEARATLDGRRTPFLPSGLGRRALVPVAVSAEPGTRTLGIEIFGRRGRSRIPLTVSIRPRVYPPRTVVIPEMRRHLASLPSTRRASRQLLQLLRTLSPDALWQRFEPPVSSAPTASFGRPQSYVGGSQLEYMTDGLFGEYHRGLDYEVPRGTLVQAPAAGKVLLAGNMPVPGNVVVVDHGQGVISLIAHLSRIDVAEGESLEGRAPVGLAGDSGVADGPLVEWRLYVHGIAVDPRVMDGVQG